MRVPAARLLALWAVLALAACTERSASYTAVYVAIDADAYVRERTDRYRIETAHDNLTLKAKDLGKLPFFITVEPGAVKSGAAGEISVSALDRRGAVIVRRNATLTLVSRKQRRLDVLLTAYCAEHYQGCEAKDLSCDGCACTGREVDANSLSEIDIDTPLADVRAPDSCPQRGTDAGMDGSPIDATLDAGAHLNDAGDGSSPGMVDAGRDAGDASPVMSGDAEAGQDGCVPSASDDLTCDGVNDDCDDRTDENATLAACGASIAPATLATGHCSPLAIDFGNFPNAAYVTLSQGSGKLFSDASCSTELTPVSPVTGAVFLKPALGAGEYAGYAEVTLNAGSDAIWRKIEIRRAARHITAGPHHTCAELDDGSLWCWGSREEINTSQVPPAVARPKLFVPANGVAQGTSRSGRQGVCWVTPGGAVGCSGTIAQHTEPTANVEQIAGTDGHVCSLGAGAVRCWGDNSHGQLGPSSSVNVASSADLAVSLPGNAREIAAGWDHACALIDEGDSDAVYCWGKRGMLGDGSSASGAAIRTPSKVIGLPTNPSLSGLASDADITCVLAVGQVYCWGDGRKGKIGPGATATYLQATAVSPSDLSSVKAIDVSDAGVCAILSDDTLKCWGGNEALELGAGELDSQRTRPGSVAGAPTGVDAVSVGGAGGWGHACALSAGLVSCWGRDDAAQTATSTVLGRFLTATPASWTLTPTALATGTHASCAIAGGKPYCWGQEQRDGYNTEILGSDPDPSGEYSDNQELPYPVDDTSELTYTALAAVGNGMCAIRDGKVVCWGEVNFVSKLASPTPLFSPASGEVTKIVGGQSHFCALVAGGTSAGVWCRGSNSSGQIGDPGGSGNKGPYQVFDSSANVLDVVATLNGSGAVFADHLSWWGAQHPDGAAAAATPTTVTWDPKASQTFVAAAADDYGLCVQQDNGEVYCAGGDVGGSGVNGTPLLTGAGALASGRNNVCARTATNELYCVGENFQGQLGNGSAGANATGKFVKVTGLTAPVGVFAAGDAACAVDDTGLKCWGDNYSRQLLQPGAPFSAAPALIIPWEDP